MSVIPLEVACFTDVGLVRATNEDYLHTLPEQGIVALADGMGGHLAGEVAVEVAVEELRHAQRFMNMDAVQALMAIGQAVERANASIYTLAKKKPELQGMGTTLVLGLFQNGRIRCPPWRAKRRRVVPGSREATRDTRRAEGAKGDPKGASERGVQSYGRPVCSRNELAMLWRNAG